MTDFFTLSFRSDVSITSVEEQLIFESKQHRLTLKYPKSGLRNALEQLRHTPLTTSQLAMIVTELDGDENRFFLNTVLQKLIYQGWICHSVLPLAIAIPVTRNYQFKPPELNWHKHPLTLSQFAFLHQKQQQFLLESPLSKARIEILDWRVAALIVKLVQANQEFNRESFTDLSIEPEILEPLLTLLIATQMVIVGAEDAALAQWKFHNLLFHHWTRSRLNDATQLELPRFKERERNPSVKPPMGTKAIPLEKPDLVALAKTDISLTQAIETRRSIREYSQHPLTLAQLGDFLYRCARVKEVYTLENDSMNIGELTKRPYPSGGGLYELEIYPLIYQCAGLDAGLYHYQPREHILHQVSDWNSDVETLIDDAWNAMGRQDLPQVTLVITARFGRLFWKYNDIAYRLILKHVGVLYQTFYLVATAMQLAACAIGTGNAEQFCKIAKLSKYEESSVGEFSLGSLPSD